MLAAGLVSAAVMLAVPGLFRKRMERLEETCAEAEGVSNLTAGITNGLRAIANHRMSLASSKPYFKNITVHAREARVKKEAAAVPVNEAITVENVGFQYDKKPVLQNLTLQFQKGGKEPPPRSCTDADPRQPPFERGPQGAVYPGI